MTETEDWSKKRPHFISMTISGKKGETKEVSASASADGRLLLFRGYTIRDATDTFETPGQGTALVEVKIAGKKQQWGRGPILTANMNWSFARGFAIDVLHPRQEAQLVIRFLQDCTWNGTLEGIAIEVPNDGVWSIVPPEDPCDRDVPRVMFDPAIICAPPTPLQLQEISALPKEIDWNNSGAAPGEVIVTRSHLEWKLKPASRLHANRNERCEHCWHRYGAHERWPWKEVKRDLSLEALEPGRTASIVVVDAISTVLFAEAATLDYGADWEQRNKLHRVLRTPGFALGSEGRFGADGHFDVYNNLVVPPDDALLFRVTNISGARVPFKGVVRTQEFHLQ